MSSPLAALAEIEKFKKVFKAFEEAEQALLVLANVEQVIQEQQAAQVLVKAETEKATADLALVKDELVKQKKKAKEDVEKLLEKAEVQAVDIIASAQSKADLVLQNMDNQIQVSEKKLQDLFDERSIVSKDLADKKKELLSVEEKIKSSKEEIVKLLGDIK